MAKTKLEIVTPDGVNAVDEVDGLIVPMPEGLVALTAGEPPRTGDLNPGELVVKQGGFEFAVAFGGGRMQVTPNLVVVYTDFAEDIASAKRRARASERQRQSDVEFARAQAELRRRLMELRGIRRLRRRRTRRVA